MNSGDKTIITDSDFMRLQQYARETVGIILRTNKKEKLYNSLIKRVATLKLDSISEYVMYLNHNEIENVFFINLITNFTTEFFREMHHFEYLHSIVPDLIRQKGTIRIWSAGCASGEEPYSIAITLFETLPDITSFDIKILATDINTNALHHAREGRYNAASIEKLGTRKRWFNRDPNYLQSDQKPLQYRIDPKVQSLVQFKKLNLLDPWSIKKHFDIIFFRNVSIYMTEEATHSILKNFDALLENGGLLIIGHSESLNILRDKYIPLGGNIYRKTDRVSLSKTGYEKNKSTNSR